MPLFEVAIIYPEQVKNKDGFKEPEVLVLEPAFFLAKDAQTAAMKAISENPTVDGDEIDLDRAQVLVRPFA